MPAGRRPGSARRLRSRPSARPGGLEAPMIMWGIPVLGCSLLVSALLLRRRALTALAILLGGSAASMGLQPGQADAALVALACAAGLEVCYISATHTPRAS